MYHLSTLFIHPHIHTHSHTPTNVHTLLNNITNACRLTALHITGKLLANVKLTYQVQQRRTMEYVRGNLSLPYIRIED